MGCEVNWRPEGALNVAVRCSSLDCSPSPGGARAAWLGGLGPCILEADTTWAGCQAVASTSMHTGSVMMINGHVKNLLWTHAHAMHALHGRLS